MIIICTFKILTLRIMDSSVIYKIVFKMWISDNCICSKCTKYVIPSFKPPELKKHDNMRFSIEQIIILWYLVKMSYINMLYIWGAFELVDISKFRCRSAQIRLCGFASISILVYIVRIYAMDLLRATLNRSRIIDM